MSTLLDVYQPRYVFGDLTGTPLARLVEKIVEIPVPLACTYTCCGHARATVLGVPLSHEAEFVERAISSDQTVHGVLHFTVVTTPQRAKCLLRSFPDGRAYFHSMADQFVVHDLRPLSCDVEIACDSGRYQIHYAVCTSRRLPSPIRKGLAAGMFVTHTSSCGAVRVVGFRCTHSVWVTSTPKSSVPLRSHGCEVLVRRTPIHGTTCSGFFRFSSSLRYSVHEV